MSGDGLNGACALISDKQLGDVTLLEPVTRLLAARSGRPCALHVKEAFQPLVGLMQQAVWGPDQRERAALSWTTSWSTRAAWTALRVPSRRRALLVNQPRHVRWWYRLIFREVRIEPIGREYWAKYYLIHDAVVMNRTDGALVRVLAPYTAASGEDRAQEAVTGFVKALFPLLSEYIPS